MNTEEENNTFENEALNNAGRQNPFAVPEGYFDELPRHIAGRVGSLPRGKVVPLNRISPVYAAAACAAVLLLLAGVYLSVREPGMSTSTGIAFEDIGNSVYFFDLDENLLVDELALTSLYEEAASDNTDMENYLIDNATDISSYYIENL